ncbi:MAG: hypothetical protein ACREV4_11165 [Gammaproteobacteria bacterium]
MDSQPRTVCGCADPLTDGCQMGGGCKTHDGVRGSEDCCQVLIGKLSDVAAAGAVAPGAQAAILDPLQLPTLLLPNAAVELEASITRVKVSAVPRGAAMARTTSLRRCHGPSGSR